MSYLKTIFCVAAIGSLTACSAATQQSADHSHEGSEHVHSSKGERHVATVKPGASVQMNPVLPKSMSAGSFQTVQLRFADGYNEGSLSVNLQPSAGLSLFGGAASKTFDMTNASEHVWDVDVKAETDGVYFLNVFAEAQGQPRSFSVRLDVGQVTQKMRDEALPAQGKLTDGGKIRVLDAQETIK